MKESKKGTKGIPFFLRITKRTQFSLQMKGTEEWKRNQWKPHLRSFIDTDNNQMLHASSLLLLLLLPLWRDCICLPLLSCESTEGKAEWKSLAAFAIKLWFVCRNGNECKFHSFPCVHTAHMKCVHCHRQTVANDPTTINSTSYLFHSMVMMGFRYNASLYV